MLLVDSVLLLLMLAGHAVVWVAVYNRLHATAIPKRSLSLLDKAPVGMAAALPFWLGWRFVAGGVCPLESVRYLPDGGWWTGYVVSCWLMFLLALLGWWRRTFGSPPDALVSQHLTVYDVARELGAKPIGGRKTAYMDYVPGHDMFRLEVNEKVLRLPRLPARLDGHALVHLSDLHFTGQITRPFFERVIERANELDGDLVALTGDIVDAEACLEWLPVTVGKLRARAGVYFVLGNHDRRLRDATRLRQMLGDLGLIDLGGRCQTLEVSGERVLLAGNEWPWFGPRPDVAAAVTKSAGLRILLAHSPDQVEWARRRSFDLLLAGHNHGGQIRFPILGPIVSPSYYGVKYSAGIFHEPPLIMHVSRGISGEHPIRYRCAPEVTRLVLTK